MTLISHNLSSLIMSGRYHITILPHYLSWSLASSMFIDGKSRRLMASKIYWAATGNLSFSFYVLALFICVTFILQNYQILSKWLYKDTEKFLNYLIFKVDELQQYKFIKNGFKQTLNISVARHRAHQGRWNSLDLFKQPQK